jgi:hypothetical protein
MAVTITIFFWALTPCLLVGRYQRFGDKYCFHLQGCVVSYDFCFVFSAVCCDVLCSVCFVLWCNVLSCVVLCCVVSCSVVLCIPCVKNTPTENMRVAFNFYSGGGDLALSLPSVALSFRPLARLCSCAQIIRRVSCHYGDEGKSRGCSSRPSTKK